ncbi:MAG: metallophosphoesterase [Bacteroidota bacterium]|nr:metallophosphoesterase [Bacteroidota bacterium]
MRTSSFFLFFGIILVIYGLINFYILKRGLQVIPKDSPIRIYYIIIFLFLSLAYLGGRILERFIPTFANDFLVSIGSFWLAAMVYFLLFVLLLDLLRLLNHFFPFFPAFIKDNFGVFKKYLAFFVTLIVIIVIVFGHLNAIHPKIKTVNIKINKNVEGINELNLAVISDIHLGTIIGRERFSKIVDEINKLNPDLILFVGDIVDESIGPVINDNIGKCVERLKSKYGIYAVTGNHEFIGGVEAAIGYFSNHKVNWVRDSVVNIGDKVLLVGREDRMITRFTNKDRKPLAEIMSNVDYKIPIILMDHQPIGLDEAVENNIDLQLSGHTHHGQIWPLNYIAENIYEVSWGYLKKGNTHFYVSCGVGTWGPPVRLGNTPEVVNIKLRFE